MLSLERNKDVITDTKKDYSGIKFSKPVFNL